MSKITKKDIKQLRERYEGSIRSHEKQVSVLHERIETLKEMVASLTQMEKK